jgi:predicted nucleotidyltransferase
MKYDVPIEIKREVLTRIEHLESTNEITVLLAIESGSRSWGFASADSDFDVRMIYMHKPSWYWHLDDAQEHFENENRGAINIPISDDLDIAGWDLRKTLGLLYKSNPPLYEWLRSPIVYRKDEETANELLELSERFYSPKSSVYHYLHMAEGNLRQYLINRTEVKRKKYLYVIRPVLACRWIEKFGTFPPMAIDRTLVTVAGHAIEPSILRLLDDKKAGTELGLGPADPVLEAFLVAEIDRLKSAVSSMAENSLKVGVLNDYFRSKLAAKF